MTTLISPTRLACIIISEEKPVTKGRYTRDFYFLPTILLHNGECYVSVELAWLKWYISIVLTEDF